MHVPREHELLDLWERAADRSASFRALALLSAAQPEVSWSELEQLSIGERDQRLLKLRVQLFGERAEMLSRCPGCAEQVESTLPIHALCQQSQPECVVEKTLDVEGYRVCFRPLVAGDLLTIERCAPDHARARLLARCVRSASRSRDPSLDAQRLAMDAQPCAANKAADFVSVHQLPARVVSALAAEMEAADSSAYIEIGLTCVACGHSWHTVFDIARYLWREIGSWATRTLMDIHRIARAYGWTEAETLALSPTRRRIYLELIAA